MMKMLKTLLLPILLLLAGLVLPLRADKFQQPEGIPESKLDVRPQLLTPVEPVYPPQLKQVGISGSAVIEFVINKEGAVIWMTGKSATQPEFEQASFKAVMQWKFTPGKKGGVAVQTKLKHTFTFAPDPRVAGKTKAREVDGPPQALISILPKYPAEMNSSGLGADVLVRFIVDVNGQTLNPTIVKSNNPGFERPVVEAIRQWKFKPGRMEGRAVNMHAARSFQFWPEGAGKEAVVEEPPRLIEPVPPEYPAEMAWAGLTGDVTLEGMVDENGKVTDPMVVASNNPWFERPALVSFLKWKFAPGLRDGHAIKARTEHVLRFEPASRAHKLWEATKGNDHNNLPLEIRWDQPPEVMASTYPVYPSDALVAKTKGRATVSFLVNAEGRVEAIKLIEASAPEFAGAAIASVDAWRFKPAQRAGTPCSAVLQMKFDFAPGGDSTVPVMDGMRWVAEELRRKEPQICAADKLDSMPKPLSRRPPIYPSTLREANPAGSAVIEFYVDENGDAQLPRIVSATAPEFGYAAAQAVATWRFDPPLKNGKPVTARAQVPITFQSRKETKPESLPKLPEKQP